MKDSFRFFGAGTNAEVDRELRLFMLFIDFFSESSLQLALNKERN